MREIQIHKNGLHFTFGVVSDGAERVVVRGENGLREMVFDGGRVSVYRRHESRPMDGWANLEYTDTGDVLETYEN